MTDNSKQISNHEKFLEFKIIYLSTIAHELKNLIITINQLVIKGIDDRNFSRKNSKKEDNDSEFDCTSRDKKENSEDYPIEKIFYFLKGLCDYGMSLIEEINAMNRENDGPLLRKMTKVDDEIKEFNLTEVINLCVEMFRVRASVKEKKVKIDSDINFPYNKLVKSINETKLKQIIINLLSNALKFTEKGSIIVKAISLPKQKKFRILVNDTGIGFETKGFNLDKPFKLYERNEKLNEHGSGLGLYIVQNILRSYKSELKCQSTLNVGSTFYFDLNDVCPITDIIDPKKLMTSSLKKLIDDINTGKKDRINRNKDNSIKTSKIRINYIKCNGEEESTNYPNIQKNKEINSKLLNLNSFNTPIMRSGSFAKSPRASKTNELNKYYSNNAPKNFGMVKKKNSCCKILPVSDKEFGGIFSKTNSNNFLSICDTTSKQSNKKNLVTRTRKRGKSFAIQVNGNPINQTNLNHRGSNNTSSEELVNEEYNKFNHLKKEMQIKNNRLSVNFPLKRMDSFDPDKCQKIFKQLLETRKIYQNLNRHTKRSNYTDPNSKNKKRIDEHDIYYANCIGFNKGKRINIIICDDEPSVYDSEINIIKKFFKEKVKEKNITPFIYYAKDGIECLNMLYNFTIDHIPIKFILIDKSMTYLSGVETANIIKNITHFKHNHVFLVTGDYMKPQSCKADAFFPKPLTLDSFEKIMKRYI